MTDEAAMTHPEMSLRCAECGHTWKARTAVYCLRCGGGEIGVREANWKPPAPPSKAA